MKKDKLMEAYLSEILTAIVSISVSYGVVKTKISQIETELNTFRKDHDLLVELNTKMDMLLEQKQTRKNRSDTWKQ